MKESNPNRGLVVAAAVFAVLSAGLIWSYIAGGMSVMDVKAFELAAMVRMDWLTQILRILTNLGGGLELALIGVILVITTYVKGHSHEAIVLACMLIVGEAANELLKVGFARPRPVGYNLVALPDSYSFPSGHAMVSTAFYLMLAHFLREWLRDYRASSFIKPAFNMLVLLIVASRVYLGVHYLSDVLTGYCLSMVLYFLTRYGYARWVQRQREAIYPLTDS